MTADEWTSCDDPVRMLRFMTEDDGFIGHAGVRMASERQLRLFAVACCRLWPEPGPNEPALAEIEALIERGATQAEYQALHPLAGGTADRWATYQPRRIPGQKEGMANLLREIVGDPFRAVPAVYRPLPWLVTNLVTATYQERLPDGCLDPVRLAVLADSIEEYASLSVRPAADLLAHLRGLEHCLNCGGKGKQNCEVDAGYGNPLMTRHGWDWCPSCNAGGRGKTPGWRPKRAPCVRGCHVLDCLLGRE